MCGSLSAQAPGQAARSSWEQTGLQTGEDSAQRRVPPSPPSYNRGAQLITQKMTTRPWPQPPRATDPSAGAVSSQISQLGALGKGAPKVTQQIRGQEEPQRTSSRRGLLGPLPARSRGHEDAERTGSGGFHEDSVLFRGRRLQFQLARGTQRSRFT